MSGRDRPPDTHHLHLASTSGVWLNDFLWMGAHCRNCGQYPVNFLTKALACTLASPLIHTETCFYTLMIVMLQQAMEARKKRKSEQIYLKLSTKNVTKYEEKSICKDVQPFSLPLKQHSITCWFNYPVTWHDDLACSVLEPVYPSFQDEKLSQ